MFGTSHPVKKTEYELSNFIFEHILFFFDK